MNKIDVEKLLQRLRTDYIVLDAIECNEINEELTKEQIALLIYLLEILNDNYYTIKQCVTGWKGIKCLMNNVLEELRKRIKEEINNIDEDLIVHFSGKNITFHIDIIEDYISHMHIRGNIENDCVMITSISSKITQSNTTEILKVIAYLSQEIY